MKYLSFINLLILLIIGSIVGDLFFIRYSYDLLLVFILLLLLMVSSAKKIPGRSFITYGLISFFGMLVFSIFGGEKLGPRISEKFAILAYLFFIVAFLRFLREKDVN